VLQVRSNGVPVFTAADKNLLLTHLKRSRDTTVDTIQAMLRINDENVARSRKCCYRGNATSIT
jgi:hypothetical protein